MMEATTATAATTVLVLVGLVILAAVFLLLLSIVRQRQTKSLAEEFPESLKLFSPTSRTIGGPGNYTGPRKDLKIFRGNGHQVISATVENMGTSDLWVRVGKTHDNAGVHTHQSHVPPGNDFCDLFVGKSLHITE